MTIRSIHIAAYLVLLLGSGVALASSAPPAPFCPTDATRQCTIRQSSHNRLAQNGHCYCCGRDSEGHCNKQCGC